MPLPGEDEPLHALVTGPTHEDVKKAVNVISKIIKEGIETPEGSNELRKMQLRELAALNGTLIEEDMVRCRNCGSNEHRHWECTEQKNVTHAVVCTKCGGHGHIATDCVVTGGDAVVKTPSISERAKMDDEYMSLMAELGVDAPPGQGKSQNIPPGNLAAVKEYPSSQPPPPSSEAPWSANSGSQSGSWNFDKKDMQQSSQPAPPPLMSQNTAPGGFGKGHAWASGASGPNTLIQPTTGQVGSNQGNSQPGVPQPLMSIPGQPPAAQPPSSAPQGLLPLMTPHAGSHPLIGTGPPVPGLTTSTPAGAPPPPGIAAAPPPPPPPSSSTVISSTSAPAVQTGIPPWQTSAVPPWQAAPVPQQDPMAAFMPMMYPPMAPPVGITPPSAAPLPPWMAAPPPPPPPPSS